MTEPSWRQQRKKQISENINKDPVEIETQGVSAPPEMLPRVGPVEKTGLSPVDLLTILGPPPDVPDIPDVPYVPGTAGVFDPYIPEERDWSWARPLDIPALDTFRASGTEFTGHFLGGIEDAAERIWNMTIPDEWIGREGKDPASFDRYEPTTISGLAGRMVGTLFGILPAEKPFSAIELQKQPLWEQILMGAGMKIPTAPGMGSRIVTVAKGGVTGRATHVISTPNSPVVKKMIEAIKRAEKIRPEQEKLYTIERGNRFATVARGVEASVKEKGKSGILPTMSDLAKNIGSLAGKLPEHPFIPLRENLTIKEITELEKLVFIGTKVGKGKTAITIDGMVRDTPDYLNNMTAFRSMLDGKKVPTTGELQRLEKIFGTELINSIRDKNTGKLRKAWMTLLDITNLPKALIATIDVGAIGRQGAKLAISPYSKQYLDATIMKFKLLDPFLGQERFDVMMASIQAHKHYKLGKAVNLFEGKLAAAGRKPHEGEEAYISRLTRHIPGLEISERVYTGFLTKLRWDSFYKQLDDWERAGYNYTQDDLKALGRLLNWSTGRGPAPDNLSELLNAGFFSARFLTSGPTFYLYPFITRPNIGMTGAPLGQIGGKVIPEIGVRNAAVSKIWASILVGHISKNIGILYGLKQAADAFGWDAEIGWNPRESDFGKIRFGPVRWDFWGGDLQLAQFVSRMILATPPLERKLQEPGNFIEQDHDQILAKFIRGKMNPGTVGAWEIGISKKDYFGNRIDLSDPDSVKEQARQKLLFMFAQDVIEATQVEQTADVDPAWAVPGLLGIGVQIYNSVEDIKNEIALREYDMLFEELINLPDGYSKQQLINMNPKVQLYYKERQVKRSEDNPTEQYYDGMEKYGKRIEELTHGSNRERGLINEILAGPEGIEGDPLGTIGGTYGKYMDGIIQRFLDNKSQAYLANIPDDVDEEMELRLYDSGELAKIFRDRYWSVPLETIPQFNTYLFDSRRIEQEAILEEAARHGIHPNNITDRSEYSSNDLVNNVLTLWSSDQDYLAANYWDKVDEFIQDTYGQDFFDTYRRYKASGFKSVYKDMLPELSDTEETIQNYKTSLRMSDPGIEKRMWRWGRFDSPEEIQNPLAVPIEDIQKGIDAVLESLISPQQ